VREFIIYTHGVTGPFRLDDLPGAGRMDLIARCISNAIFISDAIRRDVKVYIVLNGPPNPPKTVIFDAAKIKRTSPDERNIASHIRIALEKLGDKREVESEPGITIKKLGFKELVEEKIRKQQVIYMHPKGKNIRNFEFQPKFAAIIGNHKGLPREVEEYLKRMGVETVSVGKIEYFASQVITIIHYELDSRSNVN
jgi:tRNA (pseudouridine54-N1)-methyltransferase